MDIKELLKTRQSKRITQSIADYLIEKPQDLPILLNLIENGDIITSQYASWPLSVIAETNSELLYPYSSKIISFLELPNKHSAVKRNTYRALQYFTSFNEKNEGKLLNLAFIDFENINQPIAVRMFSMQIIYNLSKKYPEIQNELKQLILIQFEDESAGFKSRGRRILKKINAQ